MITKKDFFFIVSSFERFVLFVNFVTDREGER